MADIGVGHNSNANGDAPAGFAAEQLKAIVERYENVQTDIDGLKEDQKEILAEAKSNGFDVPTIRAILKIRKQDPNDLAEKDALLDLYAKALGMQMPLPLD